MELAQSVRDNLLRLRRCQLLTKICLILLPFNVLWISIRRESLFTSLVVFLSGVLFQLNLGLLKKNQELADQQRRLLEELESIKN